MNYYFFFTLHSITHLIIKIYVIVSVTRFIQIYIMDCHVRWLFVFFLRFSCKKGEVSFILLAQRNVLKTITSARSKSFWPICLLRPLMSSLNWISAQDFLFYFYFYLSYRLILYIKKWVCLVCNGAEIMFVSANYMYKLKNFVPWGRGVLIGVLD